MRAPAGVPAPLIDPWREAALKVEEDRGEATGRKASVEVPPELKHYADRRRFLSIQAAAWREDKFETPHDFAQLASLARRGELVEAPPLGDDYILYGVGENASDEPFTHYDKATGKSVALYATDGEFAQDAAQMKESLKQQEEAIKALAGELRQVTKKERERRQTLTEEIAEKRRDAATLKSQITLLDSFYRKPARRKLLAAEYEELSALARDFGGRAYDLRDPAARKAFKVRLLSTVRQPALDMIKTVARAYGEKFNRRLPVTSLVRTDEYQRQLNAVNPNATLAELAPHTTGLAFDAYSYFMTKAEQESVMAELARLKRAGRVEALRELRDHFHVFAFAEGRPPEERLVRAELGEKEKGRGTEEKQAGRAKQAARGKPTGRGGQTARGRSVKKKTPQARSAKAAPKKKRASRAGR